MKFPEKANPQRLKADWWFPCAGVRNSNYSTQAQRESGDDKSVLKWAVVLVAQLLKPKILLKCTLTRGELCSMSKMNRKAVNQ